MGFWTCCCEKRLNSDPGTPHSDACLAYYEKAKRDWENQEKPCSGSGYAHKPHGNCPGYTYDRT